MRSERPAMTPRERVLTAAAHQAPDRLPLFKPNEIRMRKPFPGPVQRLVEEFPFDDLAGVNPLQNSPGVRREVAPDMFEDDYGCRYEYKGVGLPYCVHSPLAGAESVGEVERFAWPDPEGYPLRPDARERARRAAEAGQRALEVSVEMFVHRYQYLRGFARHLMDVKLDPAIHDAITARLLHINRTLILRVLDEVGEFVDVVSAGDDLGTSTAPYMSVADFRRFVKPYYAELISAIKKRVPHIRFYLHSHGQIMHYVPELIECGVDILNPVLPLDHMDPVRLKRDFGDCLTFHGGIDIERIVPYGTVAEVRDHVRQVIDVLAPGGGYWFKAQAISPLMPAENVLACYETAREYGARR